MDVKTIQNERALIHDQLFAHKIPQRLVCSVNFNPIYLMQWKNLDHLKGQYDFSIVKDAAHELCESIYTDTCPLQGGGAASRFPANMQLLNSETFVMGGDGFMQHPNVMGMQPQEYDELIEDPLALIVEKVIPRLYKAFDPSDAARTMRNVQMSDMARDYDSNILNGMRRNLTEEFGYYVGPPAGSGGFTAAPYDFLADQLRSFSEISKDTRRNPAKVKEACDALMPLMYKYGLPSNPHPSGSVSTPLHMPMYMREKDAAELWLPTYKTILEQYALRGVRVSAFCEQDWMRLLDLASELPSGTILRFEYADIKKVKEKLGKKFIIGTNFPLNLVRYGTKQECITATRQMLDDTMEGGGVMFGFDKGNFAYGSINFENYAAVMDTVHEYGVYENGGADGIVAKMNCENFAKDESLDNPISSKYSFNWDEHKAKYPLTPDEVKQRYFAFDAATVKRYLTMLT